MKTKLEQYLSDIFILDAMEEYDLSRKEVEDCLINAIDKYYIQIQDELDKIIGETL